MALIVTSSANYWLTIIETSHMEGVGSLLATKRYGLKPQMHA